MPLETLRRTIEMSAMLLGIVLSVAQTRERYVGKSTHCLGLSWRRNACGTLASLTLHLTSGSLPLDSLEKPVKLVRASEATPGEPVRGDVGVRPAKGAGG